MNNKKSSFFFLISLFFWVGFICLTLLSLACLEDREVFFLVMPRPEQIAGGIRPRELVGSLRRQRCCLDVAAVEHLLCLKNEGEEQGEE